MEKISHFSHDHILVLKDTRLPYYCDGCYTVGFGLRYRCIEGCDFDLHKYCGKPQSQVAYPFSITDTCVMNFCTDRPSEDLDPCRACNMKIQGYHYKCDCFIYTRSLHPSCLAMPKSLQVVEGYTLHLKVEAKSKCFNCEKRSLSLLISGWAYVSSCKRYSYHVQCVNTDIIKKFESGFFSANNSGTKIDSHQDLFQHDDENKRKMLISGTKDGSSLKLGGAIFSAILNMVTGNPIGLAIDAATIIRNL